MWLLDKKGISLLVGYVLLVVLALGMAGAVYSFLKFQTPKDQAKCNFDVSLIIQDLRCESGQVNVTLTNRGLFNIDGAYIKIGNVSRIVKTTLNEDNVFFSELATQEGLRSGESITKNYPYSEIGQREVEIEPVVFIDNEIVLCNQAVVTQIVECQ